MGVSSASCCPARASSAIGSPPLGAAILAQAECAACLLRRFPAVIAPEVRGFPDAAPPTPAAGWRTSHTITGGDPMTITDPRSDTTVRPYTVEIPQEDIDDLKRRIRNTRF